MIRFVVMLSSSHKGTMVIREKRDVVSSELVLAGGGLVVKIGNRSY